MTRELPRTTGNLRPSLNVTVGSHELCAWQPTPGITWVQTRWPQFARKLSQRQDGRLVVRGVAGGYVRIFEFRHSLAWAQRLITRYTRNGKATNEGKTASENASGAFSYAWSIK